MTTMNNVVVNDEMHKKSIMESGLKKTKKDKEQFTCHCGGITVLFGYVV
jgi:hypothetical protein